MQYKTFSEIKIIIDQELDLETEDFIQPEELKQYVNDGIDIAQAEIHKLSLEDEYFLTKTNPKLSLTTGQTDIPMPTNMYSNKIKAVEYNNGSKIYTIARLRGRMKFATRETLNDNGGDEYRYLIRNDSAAANPVLELIPPSVETSSNVITIWYYRNANHWEDDDEAFCDIPEIGTNFVKQYVRYRCYDKEGHPNQAEAKDRMEAARVLMIETLTNMVPDEDSEMDKDMSIYEEIS